MSTAKNISHILIARLTAQYPVDLKIQMELLVAWV